MHMRALDKKGYKIKLTDWVGRLGNHLVQVATAIWVAQKTESLLILPRHTILKRRLFDFRNSSNNSCNEVVEGQFLFDYERIQCPAMRDRDRRIILQDYLYDFLVREKITDKLRDKIRWQKIVEPDENTLIINIRSGRDIFRQQPPPQDDYMQPPLSFYQKIIESHNYRNCLIVTEQARANPVIAALLTWDSNVQIKEHTTVHSDIFTLLNAHHLVIAHSSFSWILAQMSKKLRVLHQWNLFPVRGIDDFIINTYEVKNYIEPGTWCASADQLARMISHPLKDVSVVLENEVF